MSDIHAQSIPLKAPKKSGFDRGHRFAASTNIGVMTPVYARLSFLAWISPTGRSLTLNSAL